jgi:hypothetical protein
MTRPERGEAMSPPRPSDDPAPLDERGQAFLHRARGLRGLTPHQLARIERRLKERRPARRSQTLARAFAAIALLLMAGAAAAWASGALGRLPGLKAFIGHTGIGSAATARSVAPAAAPLPSPADPSRFGPPSPASETAPATEDEPSPPAPSSARPAAPSGPGHRDPPPVRRTGPLRHRAASVAAARLATTAAERPGAEAAIVLEGRSLANALELWRARADVHAALAALDAHDRRFAGGQMRVEARALRAEILLAANREADALAVLDGLALEQIPRGRELRTLRGELRVRLGRCDEGRSDLAPISSGADAFANRARAALAQCR